MPNVSKVQYNGTTYGIEGVVDSTLTVPGRAADAKAVGDAIADIDSEIYDIEANGTILEIKKDGGHSGQPPALSDDIKYALLNIFSKVAYIDDDGQSYYDSLAEALYPPANLSSISAVYTQSGTVYDTDTLASLKADLVVTAHYIGGSTGIIAAYTLSGTLTAGTSTITVSYGGKTDTFTVIVTHDSCLYNWDFTQSLTDSVNGETATLSGSGAQRTSNGVEFTASLNALKLTSTKVDITNKTYIFDFASMSENDTTTHGRLISSLSGDGYNSSTNAACLFVYRGSGTKGWCLYSGDTWSTILNNSTYPSNFFNNKRVKLYVGSDLKVSVYYADIGSESFTKITTFSQALSDTYEEGYLVVGGSSSNRLICTISAIKIYNGEV